MLMTEPSQVWVVRTAMKDLHGWYYVGVETENEARGSVAKKRQGERITGAKRIKNIEHVNAHEFRPVPIGDYWGPLIPESFETVSATSKRAQYRIFCCHQRETGA